MKSMAVLLVLLLSQLAESSLRVMFNSSISIPQSTVCVHFNLKTGEQLLPPDHFKQFPSKKDFLQKDWNPETLGLVLDFVSTITMLEHARGMVQVQAEGLLDKPDYEMLSDFLAKNKISFSELSQKLQTELETRLVLNFRCQVLTEGVAHAPIAISPSSIRFVSSEGICFQLDSLEITDRREICSVSVEELLKATFMDHTQPIFLSWSLLNPISVTQTDVNYGSNGVLSAQLGFRTYATWHISGQFLAKPSNSCSAQDREECELRCRVDFIKQRCNCAPLTFEMKPDSETVDCTTKTYVKCLSYNGLDDRECTKTCNPSCASWRYALNQKEVSFPEHLEQDGAEISLRVGSFRYPVYAED